MGFGVAVVFCDASRGIFRMASTAASAAAAARSAAAAAFLAAADALCANSTALFVAFVASRALPRASLVFSASLRPSSDVRTCVEGSGRPAASDSGALLHPLRHATRVTAARTFATVAMHCTFILGDRVCQVAPLAGRSIGSGRRFRQCRGKKTRRGKESARPRTEAACDDRVPRRRRRATRRISIF